MSLPLHRLLLALPDGRRRWAAVRAETAEVAEAIALDRFRGATVVNQAGQSAPLPSAQYETSAAPACSE
jgi:hypothetical protein